MAELRDGSLLFSIETWAAQERQRQALARAEAARVEADLRAEQALAERHRLEHDLRVQRALEHRERRDRQRLEAETRRLDRARQAELERALVEAAARAKLELEAMRREHAERLLEIRLSTRRLADRVVGGVIALALTAIVIGLLLLHFTRSP